MTYERRENNVDGIVLTRPEDVEVMCERLRDVAGDYLHDTEGYAPNGHVCKSAIAMLRQQAQKIAELHAKVQAQSDVEARKDSDLGRLLRVRMTLEDQAIVDAALAAKKQR